MNCNCYSPHPHGIFTTPVWEAVDPAVRGPLVCFSSPTHARNIIGAPSGPNIVYAAVSQARGELSPFHRPNYDFTDSPIKLPRVTDPRALVSVDPLGYEAHRIFAKDLEQGADIRPSISLTTAKSDLSDFRLQMEAGLLKKDGKIVRSDGQINLVKIAIDPVWHLPGMAKRFGIEERHLRESLVNGTNGMYMELVTRPELKVFMPPIPGTTVYVFGDITKLGKSGTHITTRPHDECNGSDTFGTDICTCRPYLMQGIISCIETAQKGGVGLIVFNRKEGRGLGEVIKLLVYNARFNQPGGDRADKYFERTVAVAGVEDARAQELMPDFYHLLGVKSITELVSMSKPKYDAIIAAGIEVVKRQELPAASVPPGAFVEMAAKLEAGYFSVNCASDLQKRERERLFGMSNEDIALAVAATRPHIGAFRKMGSRLLRAFR